MKPQDYTRLSQILFLLLFAAPAFPDLQWPLKEKTYLSGSFGEFRRNHIHAGVDISTRGKIGLPVYAGESGILYRVKTQFLGFGKAVYIKLGGGRFLVYAHLDRFNQEIEKIVKEAQQKDGKYEVDIYPKGKITIQRGTIIGYSGDTGGVSPHLHLELRDPDERPLNPLNNLKLHDTIPPVITGVALCNPYTTKAYPIYPIRGNASNGVKDLSSHITISGKTGLAVSTHDHNLGIYKIDLKVDRKLFFTVKMDTFSYDEFKDHFLVYNKDLWVNKNRIYYHLFRTFNNKLPFYPQKSDGILNLSPGKHSVEINVFDHSGNKNTLRFDIISKPGTIPKRDKPKTDTWLSIDKLCKVNIQKEDQYYPLQVEIDTINLTQKTGELIPVSKIYTIKPKEAVFKKATITINTSENLDKVALYKYEQGKWKYMDNNTITDFTKFALFRDITPPGIKIISTYPIFRAKIEDNGSGLDYDKLSLYIYGGKVIAEYSVNRKEMFYIMPKGRYRLTCTAIDKAGNVNKKHLTNDK